MRDVSKIRARGYMGPSDIPGMLAVHERCREADQVDPYSVAYRVPNLSPEDYAKDVELSLAEGSENTVLIIEADGEMIAHGRLEWWREWDSEKNGEKHAYLIRSWVVPEWRRQLIGSNILGALESVANKLDFGRPVPGEFAANATDGEEDAIDVLTRFGYKVRFLSPELAYDDLSNLPPVLTPEGYEVRPHEVADHAKVASALIEANLPDGWSDDQTSEWIEKELPGWLAFTAGCDPQISRIAWAGDEVAGFYLCRRKDDVGDVANVAVRRPYRMQGLSRSLMFHCLYAMRDSGMTRARVFTGIGADRDAEPAGPYKMYLGFGFKLLTFHNRYRKPLSEWGKCFG